MFSDVVLTRGPLLSPSVVRTVLRSMELPPEPGNALRVRRASGARASYGNRLIMAESAQFLRRVHASGYPIPVELLDPPSAHAPGHAPGHTPETPRRAPADGRPGCRWIVDYIPRALRPGDSVLANVRFENTGDAAMPHVGPGRVSIAFAWANMAGDPVPAEDFRTPLPIELPPGQAITLPVRLVTPTEPGQYALVLRMVMEGVRWLEPEYGPLRITLRNDAAFVPPRHWDVNGNQPEGYLADQARGVSLLRDWLARQPGWPALRLLEIGGNARPVLAYLPGESYNVDVDLLGLQVGCVGERFRRMQPRRDEAPGRVSFVCADAHNLPFSEEFFDVITMFASLHHFPEPATLLRQLRNHLRPGGFIGVFCEPVGHIWPGAVSEDFTAELQQGVNEQGFSLAEYAQIFAGAGLRAADLTVDYNSLKARLVRAADHV